MITTHGRHRVRNGDVTQLSGVAQLMGGDKAGIMYSDPPWGDGNIKFWATYNRKTTGQEVVPASLDTFLTSIFKIADSYVTGYLCIEYGLRWADMIQERAWKAGFKSHGIVDIRYKGGGKILPLHLHAFARPGLEYPPGWAAGVQGTMGYATVQAAVGPLAALLRGAGQPPVILDPCCGMGYTAQAAVDYGLAFRGNELNAKRLAKTIARLDRENLPAGNRARRRQGAN